MASTNKTPNYDLSQYIGSDKPTYLGDYNSDMLKIDEQMKKNNTIAENATTMASTAEQNASQALTNAQTADEKATNADEKATNAQTTANQAYGNSVNNTQSIQDIIDSFTFSNIKTYNSFNPELQGVTSDGLVTVAESKNKKICKIYGQIINLQNGISSSTSWNISFQTDLRPSKTISVNGVAQNVVRIYPNISSKYVTQQARNTLITINTNGIVSIEMYAGAWWAQEIFLCASLIFIEDFGDTSIQLPTN